MGMESGQIASGESDAYHAYSASAQGTNIDPQTLLATDYLNHFNEIVMLLELIPDMPECFEDADGVGAEIAIRIISATASSATAIWRSRPMSMCRNAIASRSTM